MDYLWSLKDYAIDTFTYNKEKLCYTEVVRSEVESLLRVFHLQQKKSRL